MTRLLCVLLPIFLFQTAFAFQKINAFVYHRFGDDRYPSINIDLDRFEAHLKYLKDNNYELVTISEAMKILGNKKPSKEN